MKRRPMQNPTRLLVIAVLLGTTAPALAQYNVPSQATGDSSRVLIAAPGSEQVIATTPPKRQLGYEFGASLDFLTRDRAPGEKALKFTDVVLFRVHGLLAIGSRGELFGGVDLLAKQPSYTNEHIWQGALLGARLGFTRELSGYVRAQGGPNLVRDGYWGMGEVAVQSKLHLAEKVMFWDSTLGGTFTQLFLDEPVTKRFWQAELLAETGLAIRERRGFFAMWLTFSFHFPLVGRPDLDAPDPDRGALDPQTRVGVALGVLAGVTKSLDFFLEVSTRDRGDLEDPQTTLPILSGGFDQQRILFGFNKRFGSRRR
ncbi:MAG: hypothetical protein H0T42_29350 [Deltaproteobacteria bacterium]|nr:hypothetical protein [Deltaproteobacteria bacterium]